MHALLLQVQLDSMHQRATATEAKLLDQITALQQQLDKERSARWACGSRRQKQRVRQFKLVAPSASATARGQCISQQPVSQLQQQACLT